MKKKGLIISTAVMVVVLIAALTTGTFAWFSQTATTKVEDVNVSVAAGSNIRFGVANDNVIDTTSTLTKFRSGSVEWDTSTSKKWNGSGDESLGYSLNTNLGGSMSKAVFTGQGTSVDTDENKDGTIKQWTHGLFAVEGEGKTPKDGQATAAIENANAAKELQYLHLVIGVTAAPGKKIYGIKCKVNINVTGNKTLGMNAAMWYLYQVVDKENAATAKDLFGASATGTGVQQGEFFTKANKLNRNSAIASADGSEGKGSHTITICEQQSTELGEEDLYQLDLYIFINGWDEDCITAATGTTCAIQISFEADTEAKGA